MQRVPLEHIISVGCKEFALLAQLAVIIRNDCGCWQRLGNMAMKSYRWWQATWSSIHQEYSPATASATLFPLVCETSRCLERAVLTDAGK